MTTLGQSVADVSEFALPGRMRKLAARIRWNLITPCRDQLTEAETTQNGAISLADQTRNDAITLADQSRSNAIMLADQSRSNATKQAEKTRSGAITLADLALADAEHKFDSIRSEQTKELNLIRSRVSSSVSEIDQICRTAEAYLKIQGIAAPMVASPSESETVANTPPDLATVLGEIELRRSQLQNLCQKKRMEYWPKTTGARWAFVILSGFLFYIYKPLVFLLPIIIFLSRLVLAISLKNEFTELATGSKKLQLRLQALENRQSQDTEDAIRASSENLITPAKKIHSEAVKKANQQFDDDVHKIKNVYHLAVQKAENDFGLVVEKAENDFGLVVKKTHDDFSQVTETIETNFRQVADKLHADVNQLWKECKFAAEEWGSPQWNEWLPDPSSEFAAKTGTLSISADDLRSRIQGIDFDFRLPALIPFAEGHCLLLNASGEAKDAAAEAMQSVAIRALANTPPGKARFTLIDPVGLGQNVADFMHLGDFNPDLINGKAWSEPQHIDQQLTKLTEDMEKVIQTFLRKEFATIQEYNKENHEVAEPFRFLLIFDFPVNFTESSTRRLVSIVKNGPRCGVYTLIVMDSSKKVPYGFDIEELRSLSVVFESSGRVSQSQSDNEGFTPKNSEVKNKFIQIGGFIWIDDDLGEFTLLLDTLPSQDVSREIIKKSGEMAAQGMKKDVPFEKLVAMTQKKDSWQVCSTAEKLEVPLGPAGRGKTQELSLGGGQEAHALLVGRTGSGKTNLMHVIITNLALTYSPKELQLYLIDFKGGVGFKQYAEHQLPHAKVIAIESEREFGMSVLRRLDAEIKLRSDKFRAAGVDNLAAFRAKAQNGTPMPRIFLIVDEFQEFFTENDDSAQQAKTILDRLARQGRSYGLHFLLATQSLSGAAQLPAAIMGQIKVRIALPCSEADSRLILADDNKAARSLSQPGEGIYNPMGGLVEGNNPFQVARFDENKDLQKYLSQVSDMARDQQLTATPIIFEGNELARAEECQPLKELLATPDWPVPAKSVDLFLGEPIAILPPVTARLCRQSGCNLMILTREENEGVGICVAALLSILIQQRPENSRFYIADFTTADSEWAEHAEEIAHRFPGEISVIGRQRETGSLFATIAREVRLRGENSPRHGSIFLVLQGMHRIKSLRENMDDEDGNNSVELLQTILRDGPEVGVHVIAWADTLDNAKRGLSSKAIGEFGLRVGAAMSTGDSMNFLDNLAASKISKSHRVIFADEDRPGQLVTFRPYAMPSLSWLGQTGQQMRARINSRNTT